jgi:hypothetical protein
MLKILRSLFNNKYFNVYKKRLDVSNTNSTNVCDTSIIRRGTTLLCNATSYPALSPSGESYGYAARAAVASSRGTLSAVAHGGNPQDRAASPTHCLTASRLQVWRPNGVAPLPICCILFTNWYDCCASIHYKKVGLHPPYFLIFHRLCCRLLI